MCLVWESHAANVLTIKYFVSRWIIWLRILAIDILFSTFNSSIYNKNAYSRHIQWVDSSILAGAFLTSSFCVVPESSYSSNTAISTLVVVWSSNCSIAANSTVSVVASFKNFRRQQQKLAVVQVSLTSCGLLLCSPKALFRLCANKAHIHVVFRKTPLKQQFYSGYLSVRHHSIGIYGF